MIGMQSIGGNMTICLFGYHNLNIHQSDMNSTRKNNGCDQIKAEIFLVPEKQMLFSSITDKTTSSNGSGTICDEVLIQWKSCKSFLFSYSHLQRSVGYISIRLTEIASRTKLTNKSILLGAATIDLCSLVFKGQQNICHIPVFRGTNTPSSDISQTSTSSYGDILGWILVGFCIDGSNKTLETACLTAWQSITNKITPIISSISSTINTVSKHKRDVQYRTLCILTGDLQSFIQDKLTNNNNSTLYYSVEIHIVHMNHSNKELLTVISSNNGELQLSLKQVIFTISVSNDEMAPLLEIRFLSTNTHNETANNVVLAKAFFSIPYLWAENGKPIDLLIPLRGVQGERVLLFPIAMQLSEIMHSSTTKLSNSSVIFQSVNNHNPSSKNANNQHNNSNNLIVEAATTEGIRGQETGIGEKETGIGEKEITIELTDVNVFDPSWKYDMQLVFECVLALFPINSINSTPTIISGKAYYSMELNSAICHMEFNISDIENYTETVLLTIVCRDVSRPFYPELCRGKLDVKQMIIDSHSNNSSSVNILVPSKVLIMSPADDDLNNNDSSSTGKLFVKRSDIKSSCTIRFRNKYNQILTPGINDEEKKCQQDSIAHVRFYIYDIYDTSTNQSLLGSSHNNPSMSTTICITLQSSLERKTCRKWTTSMNDTSNKNSKNNDNNIQLYSSISVAGSIGELGIEVEYRPGVVFTGFISLESVFGQNTSTDTTLSPVTTSTANNMNSMRLSYRAVVIPLVTGSLSFAFSSPIFAKIMSRSSNQVFLKAETDGSYPSYMSLESIPIHKMAPTSSPLKSTTTSNNSGPIASSSMIALCVDSSSLSDRLLLTLVDFAKPSASLDTSCTIATSYLDIDALFYDALKNCFVTTTPLTPMTSKGSASTRQHITFIDANQAVLLTLQADVTLTLSSVAQSCIDAIHSSQLASDSNPEEVARTEVGLKQAFIAADVDNSGYVTYDEIVAVFKRYLKHPKSKRKQIKTSVALQDPLELLLRLGNADIDGSDISDATLVNIVSTVLRRLDLDGDNRVSWEEWLQVLSSCLVERNPASFISPNDPYVVRLAGAATILRKHNHVLATNNNSISSPQYQQQQQEGCSYSEYHHSIASAYAKMKAKPNFVSSLRSLNTQHITSTAGLFSAGTGMLLTDLEPETSPDNSLSFQQYSQSQQESPANPFRISHNMLTTIREGLNVDHSKAYRELRKKNMIKRARQSLTSFVNKMVPKLHNEIYKRKLETFRLVLRNLVVCKLARTRLRKQLRAIIKIQSIYRARRARRLEAARQRSAVCLQKCIRGYHGRHAAHAALKTKTLMLWLQRKTASARVRRAALKWHAFITAKKNKAAAAIQSFGKAAMERKQKIAVEKRLTEQKSALDIQKAFRGQHSRKEYGKLKAADTKEKQDKALLTLKQLEAEHASAVTIQSFFKGQKQARDTKTKAAAAVAMSAAEREKASAANKEKEVASAKKIQTFYRGKLHVRSTAQKDANQGTISTPVRAKDNDGNTASMKESVSASKIQQFYRGKKQIGHVKAERRRRLSSQISPIDINTTPTAAEVRPNIENSLGYLVEVLAGASEEDGVYSGTVVGYFVHRGTVRIQFDTTVEEELYIDDYLYNSPVITWKSAPTSIEGRVSRSGSVTGNQVSSSINNGRPRLEACIDYIVEVAHVSAEGVVSEDEFYVGTVVAIHLSRNSVMLELEVEAGDPPEFEELAYNAPVILRWIDPATKTREAKLREQSSLLASRRPRLEESLGYEVEIAAVNASGVVSEEEFFKGHCIGWDLARNTLTVQVEVQDRLPNEFETLALDSKLIVDWIPPVLIYNDNKASIQRPSIESSVGRVMFLGKELDKDMHAQVIAYDAKARSLQVEFIGNDGTPHGQIETIPFNSPDIVWLGTKPFASIPTADVLTNNETSITPLALNFSAVNSPVKMPSIANLNHPPIVQSVGYDVVIAYDEDGQPSTEDFFRGRCVAFDIGRGTVTIEVEVEPNEPPEFEELKINSRYFTEWIAPKLIGKDGDHSGNSSKGPAIEDTIGRLMYYGKELDYEMRARVMSYDAAAKTLKIEFISDMYSPRDREELIPYDSKDIVWIASGSSSKTGFSTKAGVSMRKSISAKCSEKSTKLGGGLSVRSKPKTAAATPAQTVTSANATNTTVTTTSAVSDNFLVDDWRPTIEVALDCIVLAGKNLDRLAQVVAINKLDNTVSLHFIEFEEELNAKVIPLGKGKQLIKVEYQSNDQRPVFNPEKLKVVPLGSKLVQYVHAGGSKGEDSQPAAMKSYSIKVLP